MHRILYNRIVLVVRLHFLSTLLILSPLLLTFILSFPFLSSLYPHSPYPLTIPNLISTFPFSHLPFHLFSSSITYLLFYHSFTFPFFPTFPISLLPFSNFTIVLSYTHLSSHIRCYRPSKN